MSMASWTSPRVSFSTLPISRVMSRANCFLALDDELRGLEEDLGALGRRHEAPALVGAGGGGDGRAHVLRGRVLEDADQIVGVGGVAVLERLAGAGRHPLAVDEVLVGGVQLSLSPSADCTTMHTVRHRWRRGACAAAPRATILLFQ